MLALPDVAIGAIVAAVIAGVVSLIGLIVSKEQKTSEFRQAWIDALRNEISELISHANAIYASSSISSGTEIRIWEDVRANFLGIKEVAAKIRLRLNPEEEPSQVILRIIEELEAEMPPGEVIKHERLIELEQKLVSQTNKVLKEEWKRVKSGELTYRVAKWLAFITVALSIFALLAYGVKGRLPSADSIFSEKDGPCQAPQWMFAGSVEVIAQRA